MKMKTIGYMLCLLRQRLSYAHGCSVNRECLDFSFWVANVSVHLEHQFCLSWPNKNMGLAILVSKIKCRKYVL